jgi:hypothetical protein
MPRQKGKGRWQGGGRKCQVCAHEQCGRIDYLLVTGAGTRRGGRRALSEKFGVNVGSVYYHAINHISAEYRRAILAGPFRSEEDLRQLAAEEGVSVLQNFRALYNAHRARWLIAFESGDDAAMIAHSKTMSDMLGKIGKLTREIVPAQQFIQNNMVQIFEQPEYLHAITVLTAALRPFPAARRAAAEALRALDARQSAALLIEAKPAA